MPETPADPLSLLSPSERRWYRVADHLARRWPGVSVLWNKIFMVNVVRLLAARRLNIVGLHHLARFGPDARIVLVANHRSFFDFFAIGAILYTRTRLPKRILFPVRAKFFYEGWTGAAVNGVMSAFTMFPPIVREPERHEFNRFALARCIEALAQPGQMIGMHPEGTRNPNADAYQMLRPQPGIGKIALQSPGAAIVPVWIHGLTNSVTTEARRNFSGTTEHPIDVFFGPPVDIEDLRDQGNQAAAEITRRAMAAIETLAEQQRSLRSADRRAS